MTTETIHIPVIWWNEDEDFPFEIGTPNRSQFLAAVDAVKWVNEAILAELGGRSECCLALQDGETLFFSNGMWIGLDERELR